MDEVNGSVIDLRDLVSILRRRYRLIVLTGAIVLGLAFLYLAQTTPLYTSTTLILVDPAQKNLLAPERDGMVNSSLASSLIESEVEILRSNTVLLAAIDAADLMQQDLACDWRAFRQDDARQKWPHPRCNRGHNYKTGNLTEVTR